MTTTGAKSWIADLYDSYVTTTLDVPFWIEEARRANGPVLELMAGTGRLSLPLAEVGVPLTSVDISEPMLKRLRLKLTAKGLNADVRQMDVSALNLGGRRFPLIILPFQSFAELPTTESQRATLHAVRDHLAPAGRFICTMHNPRVRLQTVDGTLRLLGTFPLDDGRGTLLLWSCQQREPGGHRVRAAQIYETYDADGVMIDKRWLDVRFRIIEHDEFQAMAAAAGFRVVDLFGSYDRAPFDEETSPVMIWIMEAGRVPGQ